MSDCSASTDMVAAWRSSPVIRPMRQRTSTPAAMSGRVPLWPQVTIPKISKPIAATPEAASAIRVVIGGSAGTADDSAG